MLNEEQCNALLRNNVIEEISSIFSRHNLGYVRLFEAQFSDQHKKINFLVKDKEETPAFSDYHAKKEISKLLSTKDINIVIEADIDDEIKPIIERNIINFTREEINKFYENRCLSRKMSHVKLIYCHHFLVFVLISVLRFFIRIKCYRFIYFPISRAA